MRPRLFLLMLFVSVFLIGGGVGAQDAAPEPTGLQVVEIVPGDGATNVDTQTPILVVFNRPVVPLITSVTDASTLPVPITLEPAAAGTGTWISPALYEFVPDALSGGTTYTVTIDPALTALDGSPLTTPPTASFTTTPPVVIGTAPNSSSPIRLTQPITITFNQPVDRASAEASFLAQVDGERIAGAFTWNDDSTQLTFTPTDRYPLASRIDVEVGKGTTAAVGGQAIDETTEFALETMPLPAIISTSPQDGETDANLWGGFTVYFASPMNVETLAQRITIEPEPALIYDAYYADWDDSYTLAFNPEPSTTYTVTIAPGMEDIYGNAITEGLTVTYTTEPYDPEVTLRAPSFGYYNAYAPGTSVFVTQRNLDAGARVELYELATRSFTSAVTDSRFPWDDDVIERLYTGADLRGSVVIPPDAPENVRRYTLLNLGELTGQPDLTDVTAATESGTINTAPPLEPGVYGVQVGDGSPEPRRSAERYTLVVATTALTMKVADDEILVWATDMATGQPVSEAAVYLYEGEGDYFAVQTTDANGIARFSDMAARRGRSDEVTAFVAVLDDTSANGDALFGVGWPGWSDGISGWSFGVPMGGSSQYTIYAYSDRPVYRPQQPVYFRGIVRQYADLRYPVPPNATVTVTIYDPENTVVYQDTHRLSEFGSYDGTFDIPADTLLGTYRLETTPPGVRVGNSWDGVYYFDVQEYRAPEFEVTLTAETPEVAAGDTIRVAVDARYYFGGVVGGGTLDYTVVSRPYRFTGYDGPGFWSWEDSSPDAGASDFFYSDGGQVASGTATLDANGQYMIEIPANLENATRSQRFSVEATVLDESGMGVVGRAEVVVHKGDFYIGVAPDEAVAQAGEPTRVQFVAVDWEGNTLAGREIAVRVVERRWSSVQEMDDQGRTTWSYEVEDIPITTDTVTTDETGRAAFTFTPPTGGIYKIIATAADDAGRGIRSAGFVWAAGDDYVMWRQQNSNRIDLVTSAPSYRVGDVAEILITSPFQSAVQALVTVERGGIFTTDVITLTGNSYVYAVPITDRMIPAAYVSVVIVKGVDDTTSYPQFRAGLVQLNVDNRDRELQVTLTPEETNVAAPGDTRTWTITTTDAAGNPVSAEVGVWITDAAVLSLLERREPAILDAFYGRAPLNVYTSIGLTANADQLTQEVLDTVKGGGGGFGEGGIFDIREEFVDTPYWSAAVVTDDTGRAEITFALPDNLTTWVMDARGITAGADGAPVLVGQARAEFVSTLPVLIRPVTPRFFVAGDQVNLAALVNNNTGDTYDAEVAIEIGSGVTLAEGVSAVQTVTIPANGRVRVEWPVIVQDDVSVNAADLTFYVTAAAGLYNDASRPPLGREGDQAIPIRRYAAPETVGTAGVLREAGTETEIVLLPTDLPISDASLTVRVDGSLAAALLDTLTAQRPFDEDYQTTPGLVSRLLPNLFTYRALTTLSVDETLFGPLTAELDTLIADAVPRLIARQNLDGGWSWAGRGSSDLMTTAYITIVLAEVRDHASAATVSASAINAAADFLSDALITARVDSPTHQLNRQAYLLYALVRADEPDRAAMSNLYELRDRLSFAARALLLKAFVAADGVDSPQAITLYTDLIGAASISATGVSWGSERNSWMWDTDTTTTSLVLSALVTLNPDGDLLPGVVRWLMTERAGDRWETDYETAWAVMALAEYMAATGELNADYAYTAVVGDAPLIDGVYAPGILPETQTATVDLAPGETPIAITRGDGTGPLYYTAHATVGLPVTALEPLDNGIFLSRRYTLPDDPATAITSARVGDLVTARLTIIIPSSLSNVIITDPIPAGTDALNPELSTTPQQQSEESFRNTALVDELGWGWWFFNRTEYRDHAVILYADRLEPGAYEFVYTLRVGLAGTYNVIPPYGQAAFFPEIYGRGAGSTFTIEPAE